MRNFIRSQREKWCQLNKDRNLNYVIPNLDLCQTSISAQRLDLSTCGLTGRTANEQANQNIGTLESISLIESMAMKPARSDV